MSRTVRFRVEALSEYEDAADWYEQQRTGLGDDFVAEVESVIARISANPLLHAKVYGDVRKAVVKRFPYIVLYLVEPTEIVIVSVFHTSRNPDVWKSRV
ncbi:MAG: type II toxin-antitoxin system RelE/ParE family toxin [Gemmataceae bacterium]|nr:type II toxin-antitoxin system RelE/ParE family toxin [Planctomycetia bacterium]MBX3397455.1 type II toxin-antitoxin system RelE/ParE family toxin [Gemmataceae bacterium]